MSKLRLERTKLAIETRLKRRELNANPEKTWRAALSNPLVLAIVGGSLTLLTSMVTNFLTANATRDADERRASQTREGEARALQSELIKTFLKTQDSKIARDNLTFLIESGLIPDHEKRIKEYLASNQKAIPKLSESAAPQQVYPPCAPVDMGPAEDGNGVIGVSIHLGTNRVNPNSYGGWEGPLQAPVADAKAMQKLAAALGYRTNLHIDALVRSDCLASALALAASRLRSGDSLLLTMSGHGGQIPDTSGVEEDKKLETWVLFDKQVDANELYYMFAKFKAGVTVIVVVDADHGAVYRRPKGAGELTATVVALVAAKENQTALDGAQNGAFTEALLKAWNNGKFSGDYAGLIAAVRREMPESQSPQLYVFGANPQAQTLKPFRISQRSQ